MRTLCTQDCRTWLWGGEGNAAYDGDEGRCSCICDDERWSNHNMFGRASCVPVMVHLIYGCVGLALSVAALCHAAYQRNRQLTFHAQELLASTLAVEKCRRLLHLAVATSSLGWLFLFAMVLADECRWSGLLVSALHIPSNISGVLATRVWIYTTGHGLISKSPEVLVLSTWLETLAGHYGSLTAVSIAPCAAILLAVGDHPEVAVKMTPAGALLTSAILTAAVWACGKSLMHAIDESLEKKREECWGDAKDGGGPGGHGDQMLLAARSKAKWTLGFSARQVLVLGSLVLFSISSKYGPAAPLLLFGIPIVMMPIIKQMVAVQLFAGRSKLNASSSQGLLAGIGGKLRASRIATSLTSLIRSISSSFSHKGQVFPTEVGPPTPEHTLTIEFH